MFKRENKKMATIFMHLAGWLCFDHQGKLSLRMCQIVILYTIFEPNNIHIKHCKHLASVSSVFNVNFSPWDTTGTFTPNLFGLLQTNSGALARLVWFVLVAVKAVNQTPLRTKRPRPSCSGPPPSEVRCGSFVVWKQIGPTAIFCDSRNVIKALIQKPNY